MIPNNYYKYKETPIWTEETIPNVLSDKHNMKAGTYGKIVIISGELKYTVFNDDDSILSTTTLTPSCSGMAAPQQWHKLEKVGDVRFFIEFHELKSDKIIETEMFMDLKYKKSPHREVIELAKTLEESDFKTVLDIGCGLGRNSILLGEKGFNVTAIDRKQEALNDISEIAKINNLDITTQVVDLNSYTIDKKYDCIFSTVVLQFLEPTSAINIIKNMKASTNLGGYNMIIAPLHSDDHLCPISFPTVLKACSMREYYFDWEIIEYNEMLGTLHRKDELGNKIISRFVTILAKKI